MSDPSPTKDLRVPDKDSAEKPLETKSKDTSKSTKKSKRASDQEPPASNTATKRHGGGEQTANKATVILPDKRKAATQSVADQDSYGRNRWDTAEFGSDEQRSKFLRLMGAKPKAPPQQQQTQNNDGDAATTTADKLETTAVDDSTKKDKPSILKKEGQEKVLSTLEQQFTSGIQRRLGGGRGGLGS